jgi:AraC family transcriptional regulator
MPAADRPNSYEARLLRVLAYIYDHLDGDLSLDRLSDVACMSRFHWHRVFRAMTGETPAEAARRLRLIKAANALVHEDTPWRRSPSATVIPMSPASRAPSARRTDYPPASSGTGACSLPTTFAAIPEP